MPTPLLMTITDAGMDALVAAEAPGSDAILIETLGLTETAFVQAPTLTAIPGQFKLLDAVAGISASPNIIHVSCYDDSDDEYDLRGFGLFLDDGTLFAVYSSGADVVLSKGALAIGLIALDIAFSNDVGGMIEFGNALFVYPPATESTKGVARIAAQARVDALVDAGDDAETIVTPKTLRVRLAALLVALAGLYAPLARTISAGGIATGGGSLAANRTITVTAASQARVDALADAAGDELLVVTPVTLRVRLAAMLAAVNASIATLTGRTITGGGVATGGGDLSANRTITVTAAEEADLDVGTSTTMVIVVALLGLVRVFTAFGRFRVFGFEVKWGTFSATADTNTYVTFPVAFPNGQCFCAISTGTRQVGTDQDNYTATVPGSETGSGFTAYNGHSAAVPSSYIAIGS